MKKIAVLPLSSMLALSIIYSGNTLANDPQQTTAKKGKWTFGVGVMAARLPHYPGADESKTLALPFPYINYKSETLTIDRTGITQKLWKNNNWELTFSGGGSVRVNSKDNQTREGMPNLGWIGSFGPALNYNFKDDKSLFLQFTARKAYAFEDGVDSVGWQGETSLNWRTPDKPFMDIGQSNFTLKAKLNYNSSSYNHYIYGVDSEYVTTSRSLYQADGGYGGAQILAGYNIFNDKYRAGFFVRYHDISGSEFEDSPLIRESGNVAFGFAIAYIFD